MRDFKELAEVIAALKFVAAQGCPELAADCRVVMINNYAHIRERAWKQLTVDERDSLKLLMS